jgi:hypothetical protein
MKTKLKFKNPVLFSYFYLINMINIPPTEITSIYFEMFEFMCSTINYSNPKYIKPIQSTLDKMISLYFPVFIIQDDARIVELFLNLFLNSQIFNEYIDDESIIISMYELKEKFYDNPNILKIISKFERMQNVRLIEIIKKLREDSIKSKSKIYKMQAKILELQTKIKSIPDASVKESESDSESSSSSGYDSD